MNAFPLMVKAVITKLGALITMLQAFLADTIIRKN